MRTKSFKNILPLLFVLIALTAKAQNPVNWKAKDLMEPATLAKALTTGKNVPIIISIGPGALIDGSVAIGPVNADSTLQQFKTHLQSIPKDKELVVYCGCCPFENCPNVRPAVAALQHLKFTRYKLLNLTNNIKTDWIDKGYPIKK